MNQQPNGTNLELQRIVRMLDRAVELAHEAELTGSVADRSQAAVRNYNNILKHLADRGEVPASLFAPLPDDASMSDVGISSAQLAEYLRAGLPEPAQEQDRKMRIERNFTIGNLNLGGGDKDELSEMIRERLSEWFGEARPATAGEPEQRAESAEPSPSPTASPGPGHTGDTPASRRALPTQQARVEEMGAEQPGAEIRR
jgi:hypothetical protein